MQDDDPPVLVQDHEMSEMGGDEGAVKTIPRVSRTRAAKPSLRLQIDALTETLVDSVMKLLRTASLEALLGEALDAPSAAETGGSTERPPPPARSQAPKPEATRPGALTSVDLPMRAREAPTEDLVTSASAVDITDPQLVLGLGDPSAAAADAEESAQPPQEQEEPSSPVEDAESPPHVRLRENETVARVSDAGIVLRRIRSTTTNQ